MGKPKVIKCFANSKGNKLRRQEEEALSKQVRMERLKNSIWNDRKDSNDAMLHAHQSLQAQQHAQGNSRGRQRQQYDQKYDDPNMNVYRHQYQHPPPPPPPPMKFDMSGFTLGRSKSVPPKMRKHFAVGAYNIYGNDNEEEKIMEFSTDNSITSKRSLTAGIRERQENFPRLPQHEIDRRRHEKQKQQERRMEEFQARIKQIQMDLKNPNQTQQHLQQRQHPPEHIIYQHSQPQRRLQQQGKKQQKSAKQQRQSRQRAPLTQVSKRQSRSSSVPSSVLRTQRYQAEKIVTSGGNVMLKKKIVHVNRTRSCAQCKFRDWSEGDVAYLLVRQVNQPSSGGEQQQGAENNPRQVKWLCPDCAVKNGLPQSHYHWNRNRLPPVAAPVTDITMNRPPGDLDPEDVAWVQKAQRRPQPKNWDSQYNQYYDDIVKKQRLQKDMCCNPPPPESDDPADELRRTLANACYAPDSYEQSEVSHTNACYDLLLE